MDTWKDLNNDMHVCVCVIDGAITHPSPGVSMNGSTSRSCWSVIKESDLLQSTSLCVSCSVIHPVSGEPSTT